MHNLQVGGHVLVPSNIASGQCHFCKQGLLANCQRGKCPGDGSGRHFRLFPRSAAMTAARPNWFGYPTRLSVLPSVIPGWMDPDDDVSQESRVEILRSVEHNRLPAVLGTSTPPRGLSGRLRRIAFGYSESDCVTG